MQKVILLYWCLGVKDIKIQGIIMCILFVLFVLYFNLYLGGKIQECIYGIIQLKKISFVNSWL